MNRAFIAFLVAAACIFAGCTQGTQSTGALGSSTSRLGDVAQYAVGFINPVVTPLNMSTYSLYGTNATFQTWVNPYNASLSCTWLNSSCMLCQSATVNETRC